MSKTIKYYNVYKHRCKKCKRDMKYVVNETTNKDKFKCLSCGKEIILSNRDIKFNTNK
jgi:predicted RNA-binding Zn-ribbon protein involved in translation (DUF1610 family)